MITVSYVDVLQNITWTGASSVSESCLQLEYNKNRLMTLNLDKIVDSKYLEDILFTLAYHSVNMSKKLDVDPGVAFDYCKHTLAAFCNLIGLPSSPELKEILLRVISMAMRRVYGIIPKYEKDEKKTQIE